MPADAIIAAKQCARRSTGTKLSGNRPPEGRRRVQRGGSATPLVRLSPQKSRRHHAACFLKRGSSRQSIKSGGNARKERGHARGAERASQGERRPRSVASSHRSAAPPLRYGPSGDSTPIGKKGSPLPPAPRTRSLRARLPCATLRGGRGKSRPRGRGNAAPQARLVVECLAGSGDCSCQME